MLRDKADVAAAKAAAEDAKKAHKEKVAAQTTYMALFRAHSQLVSDMAMVPLDKQTDESFEDGKVKTAEGDALIRLCWEAMHRRENYDIDEVKTLTTSMKKATTLLQKLSPKKKKRG